jgi:hypothetical protein
MLLCCYMFRPYKAIFRQHLSKDSNSLYVNRIVFLRYVVDVPLCLFELRLFCAYQVLPCVPCFLAEKFKSVDSAQNDSNVYYNFDIITKKIASR